MNEELEAMKKDLENLEQAHAAGAGSRAASLPPWALVMIGVLKFVLNNLPAQSQQPPP